jgi:hypothetical protein
MTRNTLRSIVATAFAALLAAAMFAATICDAAPVNCPAGIDKFKPADGDLFIASSVNELQRYRSGHGSVHDTVVLKPDDHISFLYFTEPESLETPMIFALIRAYKIRAGYDTSLRPTEVHVANSKRNHLKIPLKDYTFFHEEKRLAPSSLRTDFHMRFYDGSLPWDNWDNSYDDVSDPDVYALPAGNGYAGFKAYMQRITGFSKDGRCVVFRLFNRKKFAAAVESFSLVLVALADERNHANDTISLSVNFAAPP